MALTEHEQHILDSIVIASDNDPRNPEFPADNPKFPASETYQITVPGFENVWLKDEGTNPTGTHKDRMAWEIIVSYRQYLLSKKKGIITELPTMSLISSGSAALAIQTQLKRYGLPPLRVLLDYSIDTHIVQSLDAIGCVTFFTDLSKKPLSSEEILSLTNNIAGIDITSDETLDPDTRFYDWLAYEIINSSPDYCFIPFGTGALYENILNVSKKEIAVSKHDPRFDGDVARLMNCNFLGATTNNPHSTATKLYSPHLPFSHYNEKWLQTYKDRGFCGKESNVYAVGETFIKKAQEIIAGQERIIKVEPSAVAGLALMLQMQDQLPRDTKMLIVSTGCTKLI
ncbi:PLP-dependent lyase/thiolase [Patescibacteria group bacterium]|nr:PLP-dependent lyase/thiolase [Patescibacteria group bacterium]